MLENPGQNSVRFTEEIADETLVYTGLTINKGQQYLVVDFTPFGSYTTDEFIEQNHRPVESIGLGVKDLLDVLETPEFERHISNNTLIIGFTNPTMANLAVRKLGFKYGTSAAYKDMDSLIFTYTQDLNSQKTMFARFKNRLSLRRKK